MTTAQLEQLLQRRRELASKVADLTVDLERQRQTIATLGVTLRATNTETRASREQKRLTAIRNALFVAERELADLDAAHPGLELMDLFTEESEKNTCQQQ
jgi:hypothetical protein